MHEKRQSMNSLQAFIHTLGYADLPLPVRRQAQRCLLDTLGVALAGRKIALSEIIHAFSVAVYPGQGACLWLDGREVSPPGAALANGMTIDTFDAHDGQVLAKGHAGAAIIPSALALAAASGRAVSGRELLLSIVIGYEIALRAGITLHATACDYHTSGAWNAVGAAALGARSLRLDPEQTRHALGIAEYLAPRSQMMRCIEHPTMLKDGSGWGAMTGLSAAFLARSGFTGAPALTVEDPKQQEIWSDLGSRWLILEQYFKPYAICRWAQPAVEGARHLKNTSGLDPEQIKTIEVRTFHEAVCLNQPFPQSTEAAQYSLPFPLAALLVYDRLGADQLSGRALRDERVLTLAGRVQLIDDPDMSAAFPAKRSARVRITLHSGECFDSGQVQAGWDAEHPPTNEELSRKFSRLVEYQLSAQRAQALQQTIWNCEHLEDVQALTALVHPPRDMDNFSFQIAPMRCAHEQPLPI